MVENGYIGDVRVTKGVAVNVGPKRNQMSLRLGVLWAAIKHMFSGRGVWLSSGIQVHVGTQEINMTTWVKPAGGYWSHWGATFDGKIAKGFVDGEQVPSPVADQKFGDSTEFDTLYGMTFIDAQLKIADGFAGLTDRSDSWYRGRVDYQIVEGEITRVGELKIVKTGEEQPFEFFGQHTH